LSWTSWSYQSSKKEDHHGHELESPSNHKKVSINIDDANDHSPKKKDTKTHHGIHIHRDGSVHRE